METNTKTIRDYVAERGITATTQHLGRAVGDNWTNDHHHYVVTLTLPGGGSIRTDYQCAPLAHMSKDAIDNAIPRWDNMRSQTKGLRYVGKLAGTRSIAQAEYDRLAEEHAPACFQADAADVLDCLLTDASGTDQPFEDWAVDLGYSTDSRKAEATFHACRESAAKLRRWLGVVELERLQSDYERL